MTILRPLLLLTNLHLKLLSTQGTGADKLLSTQRVNNAVDWRQCGNSLALCYLAVVMELLDSLWMNRKSGFGVIFSRCSPR